MRPKHMENAQMTHGAVDPCRAEMFLLVVEFTGWSVGGTFRVISVLIDRSKL